MRILQLVGGLADDWGGPSKVVRELSSALVARGHEVELISTDVAPGGRRTPLPGGRVFQDPGGYTVRAVRADLLRPPFLSTAMVAEVLRRAPHFDVAHVHGLFNLPVTGGMWALRLRRLPYVVRTCGMLDAYGLTQRRRAKALYWRAIEGPNVRAAARIHVSTPLEHDAVEALGIGTPIATLPQGVASVARSTAPRPERPYVLFLSRVAPKKGIPRLVEAFHRIAAAHPRLDLVIAGPDDGGHQAEVEAVVRRLGLVDRVSFVGMVRAAEKSRWLTHACCLALPSHDENFGVVVIEAASVGTPVLVSTGVGLADAVAAHGAGVVTTREVDSVAGGLTTLVEAPRDAWRDGTAALTAEYSWDRSADRIASMYRAVLGTGQR